MQARLGLLLLLAAAAAAQEGFRGETKVVRDAEGRIEVTVPEAWQVLPVEGTQVLNVYAQYGGGHTLHVVREAGQSDVDKQRDRYLEYDGGSYAGAEILKYEQPFFGYRLNHEGKNRTILRGFVTDGADGLVITLTSRFKNYDAAYAEQNLAVMGSVSLSAGTGPKPEESGPPRRHFDRKGVASVAAPGAWKPLPPEEESEVLVLGLRGARSGPVVTLVDEGGPTSAFLVLSAVSNQWKRDYGSLVMKRLGTNPPSIMVKNRKEGWIDYLVGFAVGSHGYTLRLSVREGGFESMRAVADAMAESVVFTGGPYTSPAKLPGDVTVDKKDFLVHAMAEQTGGAERAAKMLSDFDKGWRKIGVGGEKRPPPLHVVLVDEASFSGKAHGFGEPPAAYDRLACAVVATPPPPDKEKEAVAVWRGRLFAALAEAALHRDLAVPPPPWLLAGLMSCMDAAGRSGKDPEEPHPALVRLLDTKTAVDSHPPLAQVLQYTHGEIFRGETIDPLVMSWGYTHLMLFGKTGLSSAYKRWTKELEKARKEVPELDLKGYEDAQADLKRHVERNLAK